MTGQNDKAQVAIKRLQAASDMSLSAYNQKLVICISGGKDSSVITDLVIRAGIPAEFLHNHTTADAPETVRFVRSEFKRLEALGYACSYHMPVYKGKRVSMWSLIPQKLMPPTRLVRYCCSVLKETGGQGRFIATGIRWTESEKRKNTLGIYEKLGESVKDRIILSNDNDDRRMLFENCRLKAKRVVNPIIDWTDDDVWNYAEDAKAPMNPLYAEGFCRVGCIGCPVAGKARIMEFLCWHGYQTLYLHAFDRMLKERERRGKMDGSWRIWTTAMDVFHWWMEDGVLPGQMHIDDLLEDEDE